MGGAATAPPPPDTSRFSQGMEDRSAQSREWAQQMFDTGMQEWDSLSSWSSEMMGMTLPAMEDQFAWAKQQRDRFDEYVMPQMQSLFSEAELYASKGEEDRQRGMAIQDVKNASEAQRESQLRKLEGYGVDPSETRYQALDKQAGVAEAAMSALAANQAGERTKQIGRELRADAINVGTGFLSDATNSYAGAANTGATGLNAAGGAARSGAAAAGAAGPMMAGSVDALDRGAGIVDTSYGRDLNYAQDQRDADAADSAAMGGIGNMIGAGLSMTPYGWAEPLGAALSANAAEGGPVAAPGGPQSDGGALKISDGEYVVPADVVRRLGTNHFDKMIEKETGRPPPSVKMAIPVGST